MCYKNSQGRNSSGPNESKGEGETMELDRTMLARANRQIGIQMEQRANREMAGQALTAAQGHALLYILEHSRDGTSLTQIHDALGCSKAALSPILKQLRKKDYIRVVPCDGDERRKLLFGTEKGRQMKAFLDRAFQASCDRLFRGFTPGELAQLAGMQRRMLRNLAEGEGPGRCWEDPKEE